jgi:GNAT superfamily N-acetyltransferase
LVHDGANGFDGFVLGATSEQLSTCKHIFVCGNLVRCVWETLLRPPLWWEATRRGFSNIVIPRFVRVEQSETPALPDLQILSIAVTQESMGSGAAAALIGAFERAAREANFHEYGLSVVEANRRAVRFYEKMGFEFVKRSEPSLCLRKPLSHAADSSPPGPNQKPC